MRAAEARAGDAAAMLIDADNVSPSAIDEAFRQMVHRGWRVTLRRAYGGHEKLAGMRDCLLRHGVRSLLNHGKGTTDALLVVDAMDLLHASRLPPVVAIASSDADFAALALRLREAGCWVICFAQAAKSSDGDLSRCYDDLVYVDAPSPEPPAQLGPPPLPGRSAKATPPLPAPPQQPTPPPPPAAKAAAKKRTRAAPAVSATLPLPLALPPEPPPPPPPPPPPDPVRQVLESIEGFTQGRKLELSDAVKRLRAAKLLGKKASAVVFLRKHAPYVELSPTQSPNKLRLHEAGG